ncbi:MAG: family 20 glycosylhydrolase [Candidatus Eremiobacteraeota bacterium]|nr:family 20 glycosylhydrolase [Candidatus Eremiobacteraeota bacterium]
MSRRSPSSAPASTVAASDCANRSQTSGCSRISRSKYRPSSALTLAPIAVATAFLLCAAGARAQQVVPLPRQLVVEAGQYTLPDAITISTSPQARDLTGVARRILREHGVGAVISLSAAGRDASLGSEGYALTIAANGISIKANAGAGVFYGLQTLDQLLPYAVDSRAVQCVEIRDWPAYRWRGIHLDVSRHFFAVPVVERYIDVAARYKLNVFHWHLTDDQGWRIQIRRYPRLTSVGACRSGSEVGGDASEIDRRRYCGYYTQAQIGAIVAYARTRYVRVVPEIEMPGHSQAALAAYPRLACTAGPFSVRETWGVHALMKRERLPTYDAVQGYFDRRIERFLEARGRRMIGWDEILDGGVTRHATIMSWRGEAGGIKAAQRGNDAVMSPDGPLYFDAYQGDPNDEPQAIGGLSTPQMVYQYQPTPSGLSPAQAAHIIGVQGNLWTEFITTPQYLFYMLLPRMLSLSEIAWSDPQPRTWDEFAPRLGEQLPWLAAHGDNFRIPNPAFSVAGVDVRFANVSPSVRTIEAQTSASKVSILISSVVPNGTIRFTTDGSAPTVHSPAFTGTIEAFLQPNQRLDVQAVVVLPGGRASTPSELVLTRTES